MHDLRRTIDFNRSFVVNCIGRDTGWGARVRKNVLNALSAGGPIPLSATVNVLFQNEASELARDFVRWICELHASHYMFVRHRTLCQLPRLVRPHVLIHAPAVGPTRVFAYAYTPVSGEVGLKRSF
jgi:hypothetical protein